MLELRDLSKKYAGKFALKGLNLKVPSGQLCILLGPNGAGKSTLLRILCTLTRPSAGDALINSHSITEEPIDVRRSIGAVLHEMLLYEDLTAAENLRFYSRLYGVPSEEKRIDDMLARLNLLHRKNDRVGDFSRGMKQRMSIARALISGPKVLLLDEPFTGLDVKSKDQVSSMLTEAVAGGATILMTAHDPDMAHDLGHRLLVLVDGKLKYDQQKTSVSKTDFVSEYKRMAGAAP